VEGSTRAFMHGKHSRFLGSRNVTIEFGKIYFMWLIYKKYILMHYIMRVYINANFGV
jgi:hypothetical protein